MDAVCCEMVYCSNEAVRTSYVLQLLKKQHQDYQLRCKTSKVFHLEGSSIYYSIEAKRRCYVEREGIAG